MITELWIRDFAIIEDLRLQLERGFVVFTGETGAGKSIIIDAVELLMGGRADSNMIRTGEALALVEGVFSIDEAVQPEVHQLLRREELLDDPRSLTLGREVRREGRNICRVNGRVVGLSLLKELGEYLVDIHGQSEHLSLLRVKEHLSLLDRFAGVEAQRTEFGRLVSQLNRLRKHLRELRQGEA
ncbi:MAG: AAA family ATPase, partial [Chloroflexi bacterium]|nr:AAA family ATPase [Chloroflexota bacterium]